MDEDSGWAEIDLAHESILGQAALGEFHIRLHKPPYADWRRSLCLVGGLEAEFKRTFYLPAAEEPPPPVKVALGWDPTASLAIDPPSKLIHGERGHARVQADPHSETVHGVLSYPFEAGGLTLPLEVDIPRVRWRLHGASEITLSSWQDVVQEAWLGTPLGDVSLVVLAPPALEGWRFVLGLAGKPAKRLEGGVQDGRVQFDLQGFSEVLRAGSSVQTFVLDIRNKEGLYVVREAPVFHGRVRWEPQGIECIQDTQGENIVLAVTWIGRGMDTEKDVRLWSLGAEPTSPPLTSQRVAPGVESVHLILPAANLHAGEYLLEIAPVQSWTATVPRRPAKGKIGTHLIRIAAGVELHKGEAFFIESLMDDRGQSRTPAKPYRMRISGKILNRQLPSGKGGQHVLVTSSNEGWFVAVLDVGWSYDIRDEEATRFVQEIERGNPYKLDYDSEGPALRAIEDRYGEGAMYCHNCELIFWDQARLNVEERRLKHKLDGPIEHFTIRPGR
jgi:hypothetical protein